MESKLLNAADGLWIALSELEKAVDSVATDSMTLREVRAIRAALYQAATLDQRLKRDLY